MKLSLHTPEEMSQMLAKRMKELRLLKRWKQDTLASRSGVSLASLKRFEQTGKVSFENLLKLAFTLGRLDELDGLFKAPEARSIKALEAMENQKISKRGSV